MKILLIEDEVKTAQAIRAWLEGVDMEVDCAYDGQEGYQLASTQSYDVIVSDVKLPKLSGIEICSKLRQNDISCPILLLSALDQTEDKVLGLDAGADDYLAKPCKFEELFARIKALHRRWQLPDTKTSTLVFKDLELNLDTLETTRSGKKINLTAKEFALIHYMVKNSGRVLSKSELLRNVWDVDVHINTNVIEVYVNYLRNKIDKGFDTKLIYTQFGSGYILKS